MDDTAATPVGHIHRGITLLEDGDSESAKRHFAQAILGDPSSEVAWLWMAEACEEPGERRYCLERAVRINPESAGRDLLAELQGVKSVAPDQITDVHRPPLPPRYRRSQQSSLLSVRRLRPSRAPRSAAPKPSPGARASSRRRFPRPWLILVAVAIAGMLVAFFAQQGVRENHRYVALVAPLTGPDAEIGKDVRDGAQLAVDQLNDRLNGIGIELVVFDDENNPERAVEVAREIVDDDRIIAVIGHSSSATTLAARPIYEEAGIAVVSGQASANELDDAPTFFRTTITDEIEGSLMATYARNVLNFDKASMIVGPGVYEQEVSTSFAARFGEGGEVSEPWTLMADSREASIADIVERVAEVPEDTIVMLALSRDDARDVLLAIRRAGHSPAMIGVESMGSTKFTELFAGEPEEIETPGFFTDGLYASSPLIFDSATGEALTFARDFTAATDRQPGWRSARAHDAAALIHAAIHASSTSGDEGDVDANRQAVLESLRTINSVDNALRGVTGPLYVDARGNVPSSLAIGQFQENHLISAPIQYRLMVNPDLDALAGDLSSGKAFTVGDQSFREYRIAFVGMEMIELRDLDTTDQSFTADFFIYFRYYGDDNATDVVFTNAQNSGLSLGDPITESEGENGMKYRLYRVSGTFSEPMHFEDYPWDDHELTVRFQNPQLEQTELVYAPDLAAISTPMADRLVSGFDRAKSFNRIQSWDVDQVYFAQYAVTASADDYETEGTVQYSEFRTMIHIERQIERFLFKNLLPLLLLSVVTYVTLWFPAEQAGARIGASVTALLTSAVMLNAVSSQLPSIGYTVAIEWGFYVYIGTAAILILLNVAVDRNFKAKRFHLVHRLDTFIRVLFPVVVIATALTYWVRYM